MRFCKLKFTKSLWWFHQTSEVVWDFENCSLQNLNDKLIGTYTILSCMRFLNCSLQNLNDDFIKHQKSYEILRTAVCKILTMS